MASKPKFKSGRISVSDLPGQPGSKRHSKLHSVASVKDEERPTLAYKVLSAKKTKMLLEADDVEEMEKLLIEYLELLDDTKYNLKCAAVLDYYVGAMWWCKEQSYSTEQASAFFTVIDTLLNNIDKKQMNLAENLQQLKKMLSGIGCPEPPDGGTQDEDVGGLQAMFDVNQAKNITSFLYEGLFQHYRLYQMAFGDNVEEDIDIIDLAMETPYPADTPWPAPLCEAIPKSVYKQQYPDEVSQTEVAEAEDEEKEDEEETEVEVENFEVGDVSREADLLAKLTPEEIQRVIDEVCSEMLSGLETEVAAKLRKKESELIARINHVSVVAGAESRR